MGRVQSLNKATTSASTGEGSICLPLRPAFDIIFSARPRSLLTSGGVWPAAGRLFLGFFRDRH